ncbi:Tim44 domain-containing protein [Pseudoxanthobacter sp.]|uniref:Tim44 domain-containing protein n=1 Tax=Pseudoxanthobacter sp. TaxID=1925742 RepID=UPI002FE0BCB2
MSFSDRCRQLVAVLAVGLTFAAVTLDNADARKGGSFGSRGTRTYSAPPPTATAPGAAQPVQRSMTPQNQPGMNQPGVNNPAAGMAQQARRPGFFGGGFFGSMLGGLMLGGLFGMLLGQGFGGMAGLFGLIVQVVLIALVAMLVMRFLRSRNSGGPAMAGAAPRPGAVPNAGAQRPQQAAYQAHGPLGGGNGAPRGPKVGTLQVKPADFDRFEKMLTEVQGAFGREDFEALRRLTTPEILSYLSQELAENMSKGLRNEVSSVRLLQGDLAEAWREDDTDYATVAMRYEAIDLMRRRSDGSVAEGNPQVPAQSTELWTFVRRPGSDWLLSAIQEA